MEVAPRTAQYHSGISRGLLAFKDDMRHSFVGDAMVAAFFQRATLGHPRIDPWHAW
jgi:hypothetical protein